MIRASEILVAVPTRGTIEWATVTRLQEIRDKHPGLPPILYEPGNVCVALTRNKIVAKFMEGPWKYLAMVDDDVIPPPHFLDLVGRMDGFGMLALPYPLVLDQRELVFSIYEDLSIGFAPASIEGGLNECDGAGTGCVVIAREALEALPSAPFRTIDDPSAPVQGEDFLFCRDLRERGFRVGYYWDGWYADHHRVVSLAPLMEQMRTKELA